MKSVKEYIRKALKANVDLRYSIFERKPKKSDMKRKLFIKVITKLREIEDRRDFMEDEIGMDMSNYEDKFFEVIEGLFKISFSKEQIALIQMYMYQLAPDKEWDGTLEVVIQDVTQVLEMKTPEQLWDALLKIPTS